MRTALRALVAAVTAAGSLVLPTSAQAATITSLDCVTFGSHGMTCTVTGLVANPYYIHWYRDGQYAGLWDGRWTVNMFCRVAPAETAVRVVLGDAFGEAEMTTTGICGTR